MTTLSGALTSSALNSIVSGVIYNPNTQAIEFLAPSGFDWDWTSEFTVTEGNVLNYKTTYDPEISKPSGTVKWVDVVNGNDTNNGDTEVTAYKTLSRAYSQGAVVFNVKTGFYSRDEVFGSNFEFSRSVYINAVDGVGTVKLIQGYRASDLAWVFEGNGVYSSTYRTSNSFLTDVNTVVDMADNGDSEYKLKDGVTNLPNVMNQLSSEALLASSVGHSFYDPDSLEIHVKTYDGREPDSDVFLITMDVITNTTNRNITLYFDGIECWARRPINFGNNLGVDQGLFIGVNSAFRFSNGVANVYLDGVANSRLVNCDVSSSINNDGMSYNNNSSTAICQHLELGCRYYKNGDNSSDQGSTIHDERTSVLSVNCEYLENENGIVDVDNGQRVIVGSNIKDNLRYGLQTFGFVSLWYKDCVVTGNLTANVSQESASVITDLGGNTVG